MKVGSIYKTIKLYLDLLNDKDISMFMQFWKYVSTILPIQSSEPIYAS